VSTVGKISQKINIKGIVRLEEPMSRHTTFRIGGPADLFLQPADPSELPGLLRLLDQEGIPRFILGAGANILVSDRGIRGAVIDLSALQGCRRSTAADGRPVLNCLAGTPVSALCGEALRQGLSGVEFLYSMPGSVGGSVWMNARCYSRSVSEVLGPVTYLNARGDAHTMQPEPSAFDYKVSPFQSMDALILEAAFVLQPGDRGAIEGEMLEHHADRERKGHFLYPSAGSVWKNNRAFGQPTGRLIDALGFRGTRVGDAMVSDRHANILVNLGQARASEVLELMERIEETVRRRYGWRLEREILAVGDFASS
jgi:UDP-N-acetylmuramate dehydrogenase